MKSYVRRFLPVLAILLLAAVSTTAQADIFVVDNVEGGDANYTETGSWTCSASDSYDFNDDRAYTGDTSATAKWSFSGLDNGSYDVFTKWISAGNRTTVADYTISDSGGTCTIDQQHTMLHDLQVEDEYEELFWFEKLGTVTITDGTLDVTLSFADESSGKFAISDAVAIQSVGGEIPEPGMLVLMAVGAACLLLRRRK